MVCVCAWVCGKFLSKFSYYRGLLLLVQALLKKHELVINDIEAYSSTISSLEGQSANCKVST